MNDEKTSLKAARFLYRYRFLSSLVVLGLMVILFGRGTRTVAGFGEGLASLGDVTNGSDSQPPTVFDPRMDIWFDEADPAVDTFYEIEDRFVAEDFVMVTFEEKDHPLGVFSPKALATIRRLSERFLTVPGVRHVRSLTDNPWIRWGEIKDELGTEEGLIISDLFEGDPATYSREGIIERMIAVLGAENAAKRVGRETVVEALGSETAMTDAIGEPRLLGTIVNDEGTVAAIQVQVLRPKYAARGKELPALLDEKLASNLYSAQFQRAVVRGIEHFLRLEAGTAIKTSDHDRIGQWIESLPKGEKRTALEIEFADPTRNFIRDENGELVRKFFEYEPVAGGGYADRSDPAAVVEAEAGFTPKPLSDYHFNVGGIPLFERNFEEVGLADARYVPLMFLVIAISLLLVFRKVMGVVAPMIVVFGSILGMVGFSLSQGNLFNNLTMIAPNMLTAVGIADAVHLVASWIALRSQFDRKDELLIEVLRKNALPVLLTSVTTAIGFYSLTVSTLLPVRLLGSTAGIGTLFAYLISMTLVPAILSLVPHGKARTQKATGLAHLFSEGRSARFVDAILRSRRRVLASSLVIIVIALVGVARIQIDSDFRGMFPEENKVMTEFNWIEERLGGVGDLEIVFETPRHLQGHEDLDRAERQKFESLQLAARLAEAGEGQPLSAADATTLVALTEKVEAWNATRIGNQPEFLQTVDAFERRLRREMSDQESPLRVVTDLISPLDVLRKMHQVQNKNKSSFYRVPNESDVGEEARKESLHYDEWTEEWSLVPAQSGSSLVAQYYLQYENGAKPGENLTTQLSAKRTHFRMQGRIAQARSLTLLAAFDRIREIARTEFPSLGAEVQVDGEKAPALSAMTLSGKMLLNARTMDVFSRGFLLSMSLALLAISILIAFIFKSFRLALISIVPNVLPIAIPLSFFGLFDVPLHGPAILVSSIALGVCVDDTIHFFTQFSRGKARGMSNRDALIRMVKESGAAVVVTSAVLMLGFFSLVLSDFTPNKIMGYLAVGMIGLALVADLLVAPALLSLLPEKREDISEDETKRVEVEPEPALN